MATTTILTGAQFDALPYEEGRQLELIDGELLIVGSATGRHQLIVQAILLELGLYFRANSGVGLALADVELALSGNHRLRPDVTVFTSQKVPAIDLDHVPIPLAPDLAIEVISPSERTFDSQRKLLAYLHNGAEEVWQVFPELKSVMIHRRDTARTIEGESTIDTPLLPGFRLPLATVFA